MIKNNKNIKDFIRLVVVVTIGFLLVLIFLLASHKKEADINSNLIEISDIGNGFLYYDGNIYYKNKTICIKDSSDVGNEIGENICQLKYDDIKNNCFEYNDDGIYIYGETVGTKVFELINNKNILLVPSEYNINGYYLYEKNNINEYEFNYFLKNIPDNVKLLGYFSKDIPIELDISEFKIADNDYSLSSFSDGFMGFYLLLEKNNVYYKFECSGNIYSNIIILEDNSIQYVYKNTELSSLLLEMYSDFFETTENSTTSETIDDETENSEEPDTQLPLEDIKEGEENRKIETLNPLE